MHGPETIVNFKSAYDVGSERLQELRAFVRSINGLEKTVGSAVQFRFVVDTNVVLGDLRWLAFKRKNDEAKTALIEVIEAGTIDVYVPPSLFDEVDEHITKIANEEGKSETALRDQWREYQSKLKVCEPDREKVETLLHGKDPDDAFFIALAESISAVGVLSNDRDIEQMGGRRISVDRVLSLRDYSRAAAVELHIKCMGVSIGWIGMLALVSAVQGVKAVLEGISKAPDWVKLAFVLGAVFCVVHPGSREAIANGLKRAFEGIRNATPIVLSHITDAASIAQHKQAIAQQHLDKALTEINANESK